MDSASLRPKGRARTGSPTFKSPGQPKARRTLPERPKWKPSCNVAPMWTRSQRHKLARGDRGTDREGEPAASRHERIPATRVQSNASALLWRSIALENVSRMPANTGSGIGGLVAPNTTPTLWVTIGNTASSIQTVALCKGRAEVWQTTSAALRFFVMYGIVSKFFCLRQGTWKRDKNHTYENIQVPLNSVKEQQFLGLLGAHGPGYMGPAATMWVPMGAQVPVLSPNNHLNPSQGR